jgi:DNA-binding LacI/PurR family transcriptional regulator
MKITLQDIARLSGVSKTTVSYVLNNRQTSMGISPQTIEKVRSVMAEVGYKPNKAAVSLASQKQKKIKAIVISPWLSTSNSHFMTELSKAFKKFQKNLNVEYLIYQIDDLKKTLGNFKRFGACDALLIIGTGEKDNLFLKNLDTEKRKNIILLNREVEGCDSVSVDDYAGGKLVAEYALKRKAYKKYVQIVPRIVSQPVAGRLKGISDVFRQAGVKLEEFKCERWGEEDYEKFIDKFGYDKIAVFTFQDMMAIPFISYLRERGISAPEQIGVSGYDAIDMARYFSPALTTVDAKNYEISQKAVELLMNKDFSGSSHIMKPELIKGESL